MSHNAIGIDLGTTNSCVAVFRDGTVEIIANRHGNRTTPSLVSFDKKVRLIGDAAKNQVDANPQNSVFNVKRLIGQKVNDPEVQKDLKQWAYKTVSSAGNKAMVQVEFQGETKVFTPEEISSMILTDLKKTAEDFLGGPVQDAVITVPAYFNDSQRQATKDAGKIAGLNVLGVLNEPTAAAIAYGMSKKNQGKKNILIYDLGGGTFDVTVLTMDNGKFEVKATSGDVHLGGTDFDNKLVEYLTKQIEVKYLNCQSKLVDNPREYRRLRSACEIAKKCLSFETETKVTIPAFLGKEDYEASVNRSRFERVCDEMFKKTLKIVDDALTESKIAKNEIDEVVLIGGSTRIPRIQKMLSDFFGGKQLSKSINPDEAVASGAAIQAAILCGNCQDVVQDVKFRDVTPLSLGIKIGDAEMATLVQRNTPIPVKRTQIVTTAADFQQMMRIEIYEGERMLVAENNLLGSFILKNLPLLPRGLPQIVVTFDIDENGILEVRALDALTGNSEKITIDNDRGRLSEEEIIRMIADAQLYEAEDIAARDKANARDKLQNMIIDMKSDFDDEMIMMRLNPEFRKTLVDTCAETEEWLEKNANATKEEYDEKDKILEKLFEKFNKIIGNGE